MNKNLKLLLFGVLAWLIPFLAAFPFFTKDGGLAIDIFLFKSTMIVVGAIAGAFLMVKYFRTVKKDYIKEGMILGFSWFAIAILLDVLFLLPMSKMPFGTYFGQIGVRYLMLPIMSKAIGYAKEN